MKQQRNDFTTKPELKELSRNMFRWIAKVILVAVIAIAILAASELPSVSAKKLLESQERQLQELVN